MRLSTRIFLPDLHAGTLKEYYLIDPRNSWMLAAAQKDLPMFVPRWENATLGNTFASHVIRSEIKKVHTVRTGIEYMVELSECYQSLPGTPHWGCSRSAAV